MNSNVLRARMMARANVGPQSTETAQQTVNGTSPVNTALADNIKPTGSDVLNINADELRSKLQAHGYKVPEDTAVASADISNTESVGHGLNVVRPVDDKSQSSVLS